MSDTNTQTAPLPIDHPAHPAHANLNLFLRLLLALAPAAISPFVKSQGARDILNAELPVVQAVGQALDQAQQQQ